MLKPGGMVGIRNDDADGYLMTPSNPLLVQTWNLMASLIQHNGGDLYGAKRSRSWLNEAGFANVAASASYECYGSQEETAWLGQFHDQALMDLKDRFAELGLADYDTIEKICKAWRTWGEHQDAFFAKSWCEAVGWKA